MRKASQHRRRFQLIQCRIPAQEPITRESISSPAGNVIVWEDCRSTTASSSSGGESGYARSGQKRPNGQRAGGNAPGSSGRSLSPTLASQMPQNETSRTNRRPEKAEKTSTSAIDLKLDELPLGRSLSTAASSPNLLGSPSPLSPFSTTTLSASTRSWNGYDQGNDSNEVLFEQPWEREAQPPPGGWSKSLSSVEQAGLRRFTKSQNSLHARAVREVYAGKKESCWMWFCFPTPPYMVNGKEMGSARNRMYSIRSDEEARQYLRFESDGVNLRDNYFQLVSAVREMLEQGLKPKQIFGFVDEPKLRSSVRYFERITRNGFDPELNEVLLQTLGLLREKAAPDASGRPVPTPTPKSDFSVQTPHMYDRQQPKFDFTVEAIAMPQSPLKASASSPQLQMRPNSRASGSRSGSTSPNRRESAGVEDEGILNLQSILRSPTPTSPKEKSGQVLKKQQSTKAVAPVFSSDTRKQEWEEHHRELRKQHDAEHKDTLAVKIELRSQSSLSPKKSESAKKKVTASSAPTFASDRRIKEHHQNHDAIRKEHEKNLLGKDLSSLRKELKSMTSLDARVIEYNHTHHTVGETPTFKSDARVEEWHQNHNEIRQYHDAHKQDLQALRSYLHNQSTLKGEDFDLETDFTGAQFTGESHNSNTEKRSSWGVEDRNGKSRGSLAFARDRQKSTA